MKKKQDPFFTPLYETAEGKQTINAFAIVKVEEKPEFKENQKVIGKNGQHVLVAMNRAARRRGQSKRFLKKQGF